MIKKILKFVGIALAAIVLIACAFYLKAHISVSNRMNKEYTVELQSLEVPTDSATIAYGKRLVTTKGCDECHGQDLGGQIFVDDPALGLIIAVNLTKGKGGLPADYDASDWLRSLKHGLRRNGKPLIFMPSQEYTHLSEKDMAAIIAYCSSVDPVDRELPETNIGPLARVLSDIGKLPLLPAEVIDHSRQLRTDVVPEVSVEYGKYLAVACQGCHRDNMKGGEPIAPGFPVVADISSTGNPGKWTSEQFITTLRTGKTPEGKVLDPKNMPWTMTRAYTDVELQALHMYLTSL
jgi:cytochrome c553